MLLESSFIVLENIYCTGIAHDGQNMFIGQVTGRPDLAEQFYCVSECLGANVVFRLFFLNFASVTKDLETNFLVRQTSFILHPQCKMRQRLRDFLTTSWPSIRDGGPKVFSTITVALQRGFQSL